jgi:propionyl-CoA carboxylase alpha chain
MSARRITKLLVANRGEIARRIFRTAREMGIDTVAVFTEPDRYALHTSEAGEAIALGPPSAYLDAGALVAAARRAGADAVHPGYGFLAEDAGFARACAEAGLVFVGPSPEAIAAMGSKLEAKRLAVEAGVPVLPAEEVDGFPPGKLEAAAEVLGWPVLVKASAGGGGRGMRVVRKGDDLAGAVESARREAAAAFGDGTVFLEPWLESPRHVEVQVFGDTGGRVVHLFERDCSVQRRHQKVIEEAPAPGLPVRLREELYESAVAVAKAVSYVGAGTVEFLVDPAGGGRFFFLEMNTRLQVEHPVTEEICGVDLVRLQLLAAEGQPLPPEAVHASVAGHAIEARLYAEDPAAGHLPQSGLLRGFRIWGNPAQLRVEAGVAEGSVVGTDYDPMLAKVIVHAPTRVEAARVLAGALAGMRIHGLRTNRDLLVRVLRHPGFAAGAVDTAFLDRHWTQVTEPLAGPEAERLHSVAAALAGSTERREQAGVLRSLPSGWRNNPSQLQQAAFVGRSGRIEVGYRFGPARGSGGTPRDVQQIAVEVDGAPLADVRVGRVTASEVELEVDGRRRRFEVRRAGAVHDVDGPLGHSELVEAERFPPPDEPEGATGSLTAPLAGVVVRVAAGSGTEVAEGDLVVVIESMKVEHRVTAPVAGFVAEVRVTEGERIEAGTVLAVLEEVAGG